MVSSSEAREGLPGKPGSAMKDGDGSHGDMYDPMVATLEAVEERLQRSSELAAAISGGLVSLSAWRTYGQGCGAGGVRFGALPLSRRKASEDEGEDDEDGGGLRMGDGASTDTYRQGNGRRRNMVRSATDERSSQLRGLLDTYTGNDGDLTGDCDSTHDWEDDGESEGVGMSSSRCVPDGARATVRVAGSAGSLSCSRTASGARDPIFWFEAMPSMSLRQAQKQFRDAVHACVAAASEQQKILLALEATEEGRGAPLRE